ncbi:ras-related protein Rab-20 [Peromyscus maniculatus bairdii]|uniref:Ras-related protein Rab-20 n=1 Tax=Peromyscus maniculatus bairdii TaxID=230844 RepID=A0A6I9LEG0_PERMB|nr:ras-related protein Rab-20 [Peromyscus maniculatus bairdii]XP_028728131.1 ras-related protein Rab-20 isoform X1 [Peromyscus leucopus]
MRKPDGKIVLLGDMNVGKTSLLQRYMERRFPDTVSTVGGAFYLKQWRSLNISIWDTAGREQFHGLGSMYCRGAAAVILTYDVNHPQSLLELEDRFLGLTETANNNCLFAIVGNKVDLAMGRATEGGEKEGEASGKAGSCVSSRGPRQVQLEDAMALYKKILKYKMLDEREMPAAERMCFETSAKTGYNVDLLFETVFDLVVPMIAQQRAEEPSQIVDIASCKTPKRTRSECCT